MAYETENRFGCFSGLDHTRTIDPKVINGLRDIVYQNNVLIKSFHIVIDHVEIVLVANVRLRLVYRRQTDGR